MREGILAAGNIVRDSNKKLERFPERNGLVRCVEMHACPGGGAANVGLDLAALAPDMPVQVLCRLGKDAAGEELLGAFAGWKNIDTSLIVRAGQTACADVLTEEGSDTRSFVYYPGANAEMDIDDFPVEQLTCRMVHIGYILALDALDRDDAEYGTRMARLLHMLRRQGIKTSVDVVSEASQCYRTKVLPCLPWADYLFCNEIEAGRTLDMELRRQDGTIDRSVVQAALEKFARMGAVGWVLIHMPEGAAGLNAASGEMAFVPGAQLPQGFIAATVGAGDAFCAGALVGAYRGENLRQCMESGIAAATASLQSPTPLAEATLEQAKELLATLPRVQWG